MSGNQEEDPPSYDEAMGNSPPVSMPPLPNEQPVSDEATITAIPENVSEEEKKEKNVSEEEKKEKKAQEAGWRGDLLLPGVPGPSGVAPETGGIPASAPVNGGQVDSQGASACGISAGVPSLEERNRLKAEEAGWKCDVLSSGAGPSLAPPVLPTSGPMVLPPGLQPLINLDVLHLRGTYERGKGRRYKIMSKTGEAVLYARSVRRGHHHPKDFQLYDSTRTAIVGQLTFSQAADNSLYGNLECPSKVSLATIRAEDYVEQRQGVEATADQMSTARNGVKYTICNVLGQPVFVVPSPPITNARGIQIKVYSAITPGVQVSEITWDVDEAMEAVDESQSTIGDRGDDPLSERKIKIIFPLDLEVKMKAAIVAMCLVKDKIDHRMEKGSAVFGAFRAPSGDALPIPFGRKGRHRQHRF